MSGFIKKEAYSELLAVHFLKAFPMRKSKPLLDFIKLQPEVKVTFYRNIALQFASNPLFSTTDVSLADMKAAIDQFEAAILASQDGSRTAKAVMHDCEAAADKMFHIVLNYVDRIADGDETVIISSGFNVSSQPVPHQKSILTVTDGGHSGSVKLTGTLGPDGVACEWQMRVLGTTVWIRIKTTSQASCEVDGLTPSTYVEFQYSVVSRKGTSDFCAPVVKLIN